MHDVLDLVLMFCGSPKITQTAAAVVYKTERMLLVGLWHTSLKELHSHCCSALQKFGLE